VTSEYGERVVVPCLGDPGYVLVSRSDSFRSTVCDGLILLPVACRMQVEA
jgi:hypothetical protein